jgi:hypothetical protein
MLIPNVSGKSSSEKSALRTVKLGSEFISKRNTSSEIPLVSSKILSNKSKYHVNQMSPKWKSPLIFNDNPSLRRKVSFSDLSTEVSAFSQYPAKNYLFSENGRKFGSISEKLTCMVFEEFLGRAVQVNIRPDFLKNPETGRNLELDMFDPETKIAIEYNGSQHYEDNTKFNNNFKEQQYRDSLKKKLCQDIGIILIIVPYTVDSVVKTKKGNYRYIFRTEEQKKKKIYNYLIPLLEHILIISSYY